MARRWKLAIAGRSDAPGLGLGRGLAEELVRGMANPPRHSERRIRAGRGSPRRGAVLQRRCSPEPADLARPWVETSGIWFKRFEVPCVIHWGWVLGYT